MSDVQQTRFVSRPALIARDGVLEASVNTIDTLPDSADFDYMLAVGDKPVTVFASLFVDADAETRLYEATEVSANGNAIPLINRNRLSADELPESVFFDTPTVTDVGDLLFTTFVGGGADKNPSKNYGAQTSISPLVLLPNTNYLLRITNLTAGDAAMSLALSVVEDAPPG